MISLPEFQSFLHDMGIDSYETGQSLAIKDCPVCGASNYKVLLRVTDSSEEMFFGRCLRGRCQQNFSSLSYLIKAGASREDALHIHGMNAERALEEIVSSLPPVFEVEVEEKEEITYVDTSKFKSIEDYPNHPCSKYAIKRGYTSDFKDLVKIDTDAGSVVFLVKDDKGCVGYQERFLFPKKPSMKSKTSKGFSKSGSIMVFDGGGDILVCEGPFTALTAARFGYTGVCTFGSGVSKNQLEHIDTIIGDKEVGVAYEGDQAGKKAYSQISSFFYWKNKKVFKVLPEKPDRDVPAGYDINDAFQDGLGVVVESAEFFEPSIPDFQF